MIPKRCYKLIIIFHRGVALDMRGYSESAKPSGVSEYSTENLTSDIKEFVEYLGKYMFLMCEVKVYLHQLKLSSNITSVL